LAFYIFSFANVFIQIYRTAQIEAVLGEPIIEVIGANKKKAKRIGFTNYVY